MTDMRELINLVESATKKKLNERTTIVMRVFHNAKVLQSDIKYLEDLDINLKNRLNHAIEIIINGLDSIEINEEPQNRKILGFSVVST